MTTPPRTPRYKAGEQGIPSVRAAANAKDFGAKGDGNSDDTDAIMRAIGSIQGQGALYFPPGVCAGGRGRWHAPRG